MGFSRSAILQELRRNDGDISLTALQLSGASGVREESAEKDSQGIVLNGIEVGRRRERERERERERTRASGGKYYNLVSIPGADRISQSLSDRRLTGSRCATIRTISGHSTGQPSIKGSNERGCLVRCVSRLL